MNRRGSGENGAVAVEAALVLPLLVLLFLGTVDLALLMRDHVSATSLTRSGARVASSLPRFGTNITYWGHCSPPDNAATCPTAPVGASSFAQDAANAIQAAGSALPKSSIDFVWVYRADTNGLPQSPSSASTCDPRNCVKYVWNNGSPGRFKWVSGNWDPRTIDSCLGESTGQSVGVFLQGHHDWLFGLFGAPSTELNARTVMRFEPRRPADDTDLLDPDRATATKAGFFPGCR